ncbi:unnamed protein product [Nezara viridula]|uniref:Chitin-binding type-2 domain-containing protein n=1 Tax=Nezara viridula TaxID=85310 RepID=A0A9P0MGZ3_NEZVI|nr:unnamed protein product [Nezara viridula]
MYWTHLIFVLLYGVVTHWDQIAASKPGYLDFDNLPETNFSCDKKVIGGYYADVETGCQMFHVCTIGQKGEITDIKFLCLNGTVFDQETRVCERIDEVDCSKSEDFFGLNLELYGNNANLGIQPENEFECEDCSTDEDYEESEEATTFATSTTTTTTTTTTPKPTTTPTTTTTTTPRPTKYQTSSQDSIAALLALHNAFNQGLQNSKVKPAPPRVINNAFSPTKSTPKPYTAYTTQRTSSNFKPHTYNSDSQSFGSLNLQQQERPYFFTPTTERSNYHHFHSGDTSFGHSYDSTRPYNFQYFHARKLPEAQGTISVVTSTSTSTSVKTSKGNTTVEYPTGYEDYQDDIHEVHDSFFADVPKIRQKRTSENDTQLQKPERQFDKYYTVENKLDAREEFLQNLLGSIDIEDRVKQKMSNLFKKEESEMEKLENYGGVLANIGNRLVEKVKDERDVTKTGRIQEGVKKLNEWKKQFDDMRKDIDLNYTFEANVKDVESKIRKKRQTSGTGEIRRVSTPPPPTRRAQQRRTQQSTSTEPQRSNRRKVIRQKIDTENFNFGGSRRTSEGVHPSKPVSEAIDNDFTTIEYRKTSRRGREQPRATTSLRRAFKFNYETTTAFTETERKPPVRTLVQPKPTKTSWKVQEEDYHLASSSPSPPPVRRSRKRPPTDSTTTTQSTLTTSASLSPDPNFDCEGKVKGGFYADMHNDCRGFFICSQGEINGPLLKSHFWCGATTKFNQRSRTCQAEDLVECSVSTRYFHLNNDFLPPVSEDELKGGFEPLKVS